MPWATAALQAGTAIYGAVQGRHAASATQRAGQQSADEYRRARDAAQAGQQPYSQYGQGAGGLGGLSQLAAGDYSGFQNSPDYLYARQQMQDGFEHGAAAKGRLFSGGAQVDLANSMNGLASQNLGNFRNSLQWGAGLGQRAATTSGQFGMDAAQGITGGLQGIAQGAQDRAGANMGLANSLSGIGAGMLGSYHPQSTGSSYGGTSNQFGMPSYNSGNNPMASSAGNWNLGGWH